MSNITFSKKNIDTTFANIFKSQNIFDFLIINFVNGIGRNVQVQLFQLMETLIGKTLVSEAEKFNALKSQYAGIDLSDIDDTAVIEITAKLKEILTNNLIDQYTLFLNSLNGEFGNAPKNRKFKKYLPVLEAIEEQCLLHVKDNTDPLTRLSLLIEEVEEDNPSDSSEATENSSSSKEDDIPTKNDDTVHETKETTSSSNENKAEEPKMEEEFEFDFQNVKFDFVKATASLDEFIQIKKKLLVGLEALLSDMTKIKPNKLKTKVETFLKDTIEFLNGDINGDTLDEWNKKFQNFKAEMSSAKIVGGKKLQEIFESISEMLENVLKAIRESAFTEAEDTRNALVKAKDFVVRCFNFIWKIFLELIEKTWRFVFVWNVTFATFQENRQKRIPTFELERVLMSW